MATVTTQTLSCGCCTPSCVICSGYTIPLTLYLAWYHTLSCGGVTWNATTTLVYDATKGGWYGEQIFNPSGGGSVQYKITMKCAGSNLITFAVSVVFWSGANATGSTTGFATCDMQSTSGIFGDPTFPVTCNPFAMARRTIYSAQAAVGVTCLCGAPNYDWSLSE